MQFNFIKNPGIILWGLMLWPLGIKAQTIPDNTLGAEASKITPNVELNGQIINRIDGGALRGSNLFHSFSQFNIETGQNLYFANPQGIENIFSRVTGANSSNILGTLGVLGNANLYLLNPNGIVFGPKASLDLKGSFFATTAPAIKFADNAEFGKENNQTILTVNVPIGLGLGSSGVRVEGSQLKTNPGQKISLTGSNIELLGGKLSSAGGTIELRGGDINSKGAILDTSSLGGGEIKLTGNQISIISSQILANTLTDGNGRGININANQFSMTEKSLMSSVTIGSGNAGNININADRVQIIGGQGSKELILKLFKNSFNPATDPIDGLLTISLGSGNAGNIAINSRQINLDGLIFLSASLKSGNGGAINLNATESITLLNQTLGTSGTAGTGNAGNVSINTANLTFRDGSLINSSPGPTSTGKGGNFTVNARESVLLDGVPVGYPVPGGIFTTSQGKGDAGNLELNTKSLILLNGNQVSAASSGAGKSGNLTVNADNIEVSGISPDYLWRSSLTTTSSLLRVIGQSGKGEAGNLLINTRRLAIRGGARVTADTGSEGAAGVLRINASEFVEVSGFTLRFILLSNVDERIPSLPGAVSSAISSYSTGSGNGGILQINTPLLLVNNYGQIQSSGLGKGSAGSLEIEAKDILLSNYGAFSATTKSGAGGNIRIDTNRLLMRNNGQISTEAIGSGNGGNISINANTITALENSNIRANAIQGRGGNILINTQGLFLSRDRQITASSERGISGVVQVQTPDTQIENTLTPLSGEFVSPEVLVANSCLSRQNERRGSFTVTGKGGLPVTPFDSGVSRFNLLDVEPISGNITWQSDVPLEREQKEWRFGAPIVEAQGVVSQADGRILLGVLPKREPVLVQDIFCSTP